MDCRRLGIGALVLLLPNLVVGAEEAFPFPREPVLQLQAGGPTAAVNALAFAPDGKTLYAAGYDKVVHAYVRGEDGFTLATSYRIPIGPGGAGAINALALSPDGRWLAAAGFGLMREATGFRQTGFLMPGVGRMSPDMLEDQGTIYLFDTKHKDAVRALRGHRGPVLSMTFAPARPGKPALLVSLAREINGPRASAVLRLWDAVAGKELARKVGPDDPGAGRPGLAAWPTGAALTDLCAALAVVGRPLRVWDVARDTLAPIETKPPGFFNGTAAFFPHPTEPTRGTLLTGYFAAPGARLQRWRINGAAVPQALDELPPVLVHDAAPVALTVLPSHKAVFALLWFKNKEYRLFVLRPGQGGFTLARPEGVPLWRGSHLAALAVSADGASLSVASDGGHEVLVFGLADLLAGRSPAPERLRSDGVLVNKVAFIRRGKDQGLLLTAAPPRVGARAVQWAFDFSGRLTRDTDGWKLQAPAGQDRWTVVEVKPPLGGKQTFSFQVEGPDGKTQVRLHEHQLPTAFALLPPVPPLRAPLLAVAFIEHGVTYLRLYDVRSGQPCRQYSGHVNPIRGLAFSADGRLLASAGEDKTVCVWSLTDLVDTLGKRGMLAGLAVEKGRDGLLIVQLDNAQLSPANAKALNDGKVEQGDVLDGIVKDKRLHRFPSSHAFYEALWQTTPGKKVALQVRDKGQVLLEIDQGVDDVPPLFSLFLARAGEEVRWLAWSPSGPYDLGDARLERHIGWHLNPARPGLPVEFNSADKYRKEYLREGILRSLVKHAALAPALKDWEREPAPAPGMSLRIEEVGPDPERDAKGHPVIRKGPLTLRARLTGVPQSKVKKVQWRLDDGPWRDFDTVFGLDLTADLSGLKWKRGLHELRLAATTIDAIEHHAGALWVHYAAWAPLVEFDPAWLKKFPLPERPRVNRPELDVAARFTPGDNGTDGPKVQVVLRLNGKEVKDATRADPLIRGKVTLKEGVNELVVHAENEGAAPGSPPESATRRLLVEYVPVKPPPAATIARITLESVQPDGGEAITLPAGAVVVSVPGVRIRGRVIADGPLTEVALDGRPVPAFKPDLKVQSFALDVPVKLEPARGR